MELVQEKYVQTEFGLIPSDWKIIRLRENSFITKLAGFEYSLHFNSYKDGGDIIVVRGTNITHNKLDITDIRTIPTSTSNKLLRSKLYKNDLVFAYVGTIGPIFLIKDDNKFHLGPNTCKITVDKDLDSVFLFQYFTSSLLKNEIIEHTSIGAQPSLSMSKIRSFKIIKPPIQEQTAIANALSDVDNWIDSLEQLIAKKRLIKQGAMQELLKPKEGWEVKKLGEICEIKKGKGISKSQLNIDGKYKCILYGELFTTYKEVIKTVFSKTNFEESIFSKEQDILFPGSTTTTGIDLAKSSTILESGVLLGGDIIIVRKLNYDYNSIFLTYFLNVIKRNEIAQSTKGITIHHLYGSDLSGIEVEFPEIKEQTRIANILNDMDTEITTLKGKLEKAKQVKLGMMQELLTGRIRLV